MKHKNISSVSSALLIHFNGLNKACFTLPEATNFLSNNKESSVRELMNDMIKRGLLLRIKGGLYCIIPFEENAQTYFPDWHIVAKYLVKEKDYYIGYYSALQIHSLITQPSLIEQVVVNKTYKPSIQKIKGVKFQFIYHNKEHFFGSTDIWIDSYNKVLCSDLEKTFIDCLFKPDYAGGIVEIVKAIHKSQDKIDYYKLFEYVQRFNSQAVIKRLGFLLELLEINNPIIIKLNKIKTNSFTLLEPSLKKEGKMITRWSLQQNLDTNSILSPIST